MTWISIIMIFILSVIAVGSMLNNAELKGKMESREYEIALLKERLNKYE